MFNLYKAANNKDFNFWIYIQVDFESFKVQHFNKLNSFI